MFCGNFHLARDFGWSAGRASLHGINWLTNSDSTQHMVMKSNHAKNELDCSAYTIAKIDTIKVGSHRAEKSRQVLMMIKTAKLE